MKIILKLFWRIDRRSIRCAPRIMKFTANRSTRRRVFDLSIAIWFQGGTQNFQQGQQIHYRDPYVQEWNLTIERDLGFGTALRVSYDGITPPICRLPADLKPGSGEYSRISKSQPHSALSLLGETSDSRERGHGQLPGGPSRLKKIFPWSSVPEQLHICEKLSNEAAADRPRRSPARAVALWTTRTILASTTATSHTHAGIDS